MAPIKQESSVQESDKIKITQIRSETAQAAGSRGDLITKNDHRDSHSALLRNESRGKINGSPSATGGSPLSQTRHRMTNFDGGIQVKPTALDSTKSPIDGTVMLQNTTMNRHPESITTSNDPANLSKWGTMKPSKIPSQPQSSLDGDKKKSKKEKFKRNCCLGEKHGLHATNCVNFNQIKFDPLHISVLDSQRLSKRPLKFATNEQFVHKQFRSKVAGNTQGAKKLRSNGLYALGSPDYQQDHENDLNDLERGIVKFKPKRAKIDSAVNRKYKKPITKKRGKSGENAFEYVIQSDGDQQIDIASNGEVRNIQSFKIPLPDHQGDASHERHGTLVSGTRNNNIDSAKIPQKNKNAVVYSSFPNNPVEQELFQIGQFEINKSLVPEDQRQLISNLTQKHFWDRDTGSSGVMDEQKLGQQLKLMADQLQPLNNSDIQEMQRNKEILPHESSFSDKNQKQLQIAKAMNSWAQKQEVSPRKEEESPKRHTISPRSKNAYGGGYNAKVSSVNDLKRITSTDNVLNKVNTLGNQSKNSITSPKQKSKGPLSQNTQLGLENRHSAENLSVVGHEFASARKELKKESLSQSPLRVVVSSTIKINGQNKHIKVQSMINKQKDRSRSGSKKQRKQMGQGNQPSKKIDFVPTAEPYFSQPQQPSLQIVNNDISNVQQPMTESQRIMQFDVQEEFTKYQYKIQRDEQNQIYKYNLDKDFHVIKEESPNKFPKRTNSFVSIATFNANKKGMIIKPSRKIVLESESPDKQISNPRRSQSHKNIFQINGTSSKRLHHRIASDFNVLNALNVRKLPSQNFNKAQNFYETAPKQPHIIDIYDQIALAKAIDTAKISALKGQLENGVNTQGTPGLNVTNNISDGFGRNMVVPHAKPSGSISYYTKSDASPNRLKTIDSREDGNLQTTLKRLNQSPQTFMKSQDATQNFLQLQPTSEYIDDIEQRIIDEGLQASNAAVGKFLSDEGLGITASAGAISPHDGVEFIDSGRTGTKKEQNTLEAASDNENDLEQEHESGSPQKLELARYNQSIPINDKTALTHIQEKEDSLERTKFLKIGIDNSKTPQSSKSPAQSAAGSQVASPSPLGVSVYPEGNQQSKRLRRPISPKEYSGESKKNLISPYLSNSMQFGIQQHIQENPRLSESQTPQHLQQLLIQQQNENVAQLEQIVLLSKAGSLSDEKYTQSQVSHEGADGYDSGQNLRAMLNSGQDQDLNEPHPYQPLIIRSNTANRFEDQMDPMASWRNQNEISYEVLANQKNLAGENLGLPQHRITSKMKTRVSQRIYTRDASDSRLNGSLGQLGSSNRQDNEFSVAEMSAQVMMDQNEGITEGSRELNGSYGTGLGQLLQGYQHRQPPNVITISNVQKRTQQSELEERSYPQIQESQFRNVDLEMIFKEAIKYHEDKRKQSIEKNTKQALFAYFRDNIHEILSLDQVNHQQKTQYHTRQLVKGPQSQTSKNYTAFRRQDDIDIHIKHVHNEKQGFQQQQDFAVMGKKLHSLKSVAIQQQLYAHMQQQIQYLHELEYQNYIAQNKIKAMVKVDINASNIVDNFQKHLLPTISSRQAIPTASNVQSTRRNKVQPVFSSLGHSGLNIIGGPRQAGSPQARGGESISFVERNQSSAVSGMKESFSSNMVAVQAQAIQNTFSQKSLFQKMDMNSKGTSESSPQSKNVYLNEKLSSKSGNLINSGRPKDKQSSVVSQSGYGGAGLKSPRMDHLKGSVVASANNGLKFDLKEAMIQENENQISKRSPINILELDQSRDASPQMQTELIEGQSRSKSNIHGPSNNYLRDSSKFADSNTNHGKSEGNQKAVHDVYVVLTQRDNRSNHKSPRNKNNIGASRTIQQDSEDKKKQLALPVHIISKLGDSGKNSSGPMQSHSMREIRQRVQQQTTQQTLQPINMSNPQALTRAKGSQESLKKMTANESDQQMSNYHITRPMMKDGSDQNIQKVSQIPIAETLQTSDYNAVNSIKKQVITQGGRNLGILVKEETTGEKLLRKIATKNESNSTIDIHGVIQPKSMRSMIDLKEAQEQFYQQQERAISVHRSKSKLMENIGKSFQNIKFNKTAEIISQNLRKDKGMPAKPEDKSFEIKVQYTRNKSVMPLLADKATLELDESKLSGEKRKHIRLESMGNHSQLLQTVSRMRDRSVTPDVDRQLNSVHKGEVFLKQKMTQDESGLYQASAFNSDKKQDQSLIQSRQLQPSPIKSPQVDEEIITERHETPGEQLMIQSEMFDFDHNNMMLSSNTKTSVFNETGILSNPQRLSKTLMSKTMANPSKAIPQNFEKASQKSQGQIQYIIKNPTSHEISSSRLVENSAVFKQRPGKARLHSAIHQGNLRSSFGYDKNILPGKERAGLVLNEGQLRVGEISSYSTAGGIGTTTNKLASRTKILSQRLYSGKPTQAASSVVRDRESQYINQKSHANIQETDHDYIESSNFQGKMRPRTAKVGGVVNNLRQFSGVGNNSEAANMQVQAPQFLNKDPTGASSSFHMLQSYQNRQLQREASSLPHTNTFGYLSKAGPSTEEISRFNSNQDLHIIQTEQEMVPNIMRKKQIVASMMQQVLPPTRPKRRQIKSQPQGHFNQNVSRRVKRGKVFKDENFEPKRRDGKSGIIFNN